MILSSKITLKFANTGKKDKLNEFIEEYRKAVAFFVDYIWNNYKIDQQKYKLPLYITTTNLLSDSPLSARAIKCASGQALGCVKSRVRKLQKTQYVIKKHQKQGKDICKLQSKYDYLLLKLKKPNVNNIFPELCALCCEFKKKKTFEFDGVIILHAIGKKYGKINIPIKFTRHSSQLASLGRQMTSFLITEKDIHFRYDIKVEQKESGKTEGADQGINTCITLSDGQITLKDIHGHDLSSICKKISRKKKGSKAFAKAQAHRTNYINWSIKQLNLSDIKQINLEKLKQVGKGKRTSRLLQSFTYKEIKTQMNKVCFLAGVQIKEQSNAYRSQRCNSCGFVHKLNRHSKSFTCRKCGFALDADLNAAMNHRDKLYDLPFKFNRLPNRSSGFYWKSSGIFAADGSEITVPVA